MIRAWRWWVDGVGRTGDVRPQALVRVLLGLVMAWDLGQLLALGIAGPLYTPAEAGGLVVVPEPWYVLDRVLPAAWAGPAACGGALLGYLLGALGIFPRVSVLVAVLLHAQLGHLVPATDRGIDQLIRAVMVMLLFGDGHRVRGFGQPTIGVTWPAALVRFQLVLMYLGAGLAKLLRDRDWFAWSDAPPLVTILSDPLVGTLPPRLAMSLAAPLYALGVATLILELTAPLLLTRWRAWWGAVAVVMHLGIALTLDIGAFSAGVLAIFPIVFGTLPAPLTRWMDRVRRGRAVSPAD